MNYQKSILAVIFLLINLSLFAQTRVCFESLGGSAAIPAFEFAYEVKTLTTTVTLDPIKDGDCWLMTFPGLDQSKIEKVSILAKHDEAPLNGVSTYDMVIISRFIVGLGPDDCPNQEQILKILSSDINNNGVVTTFDLVQLRQLILHIITDFPTNQSWRFVNGNGLEELADDPNFEFNNLLNTDLLELVFSPEDLEEEIKVVAYKVGDANGYCN